jgi:hypothetical protein
VVSDTSPSTAAMKAGDRLAVVTDWTGRAHEIVSVGTVPDKMRRMHPMSLTRAFCGILVK